MAVRSQTNGDKIDRTGGEQNGASSKTNNQCSVFVMDPYHPDAIASLQAARGIRVVLPSDPERHNFRKEATTLLIRSDTRLSAEDLGKCERLECIVKQGVGLDNVDVQAAAKLGIKVYYTPGLNAEAVAELSLSMALAMARRVIEMDRRIRNGETIIRSQNLGLSLFQKTLGVVGIGSIGVAFAKKWIGAMNGHVVAFDPFSDGRQSAALPGNKFRRVDTLEELLRVSDVVSLHVPLTDSTRNSISTVQFAQMKPNSILLNAARGGVVDESALLAVLATGKLFGVGLDAVETEPPSMNNYAHLLQFPNVTILPHVGASTMENQSLSGVVAVETALEVSHGRNVSRGTRVV